MANPQKGEVAFEAGGKTYVFKLGTYAQAVLERRENMSLFKFLNRKPEEWSISNMLSVFYSGLFQQYQFTEEQVASLIDELGQQRVGEIVAEALSLAFREGETNNENPRVAKLHGIGNG